MRDSPSSAPRSAQASARDKLAELPSKNASEDSATLHGFHRPCNKVARKQQNTHRHISPLLPQTHADNNRRESPKPSASDPTQAAPLHKIAAPASTNDDEYYRRRTQRYCFSPVRSKHLHAGACKRKANRRSASTYSDAKPFPKLPAPPSRAKQRHCFQSVPGNFSQLRDSESRHSQE